ncbi:MAG: hypothetical protein JSW71_11630 [Gemmatimonadota bacterium]|nr:MAG: hypothetical protein JSW71_11630 [Gemmatimonadota bacterium]
MHRSLTAFLPGSLLLMSCATVGGLRSEPLDQGVARRFPVPFDSVMDVVREAVVAAGLGLKESQCYSDSLCVVIGTKGLTVGASGNMGTMARVVVEGSGEATVVRVLSRRRIGTQVAAKEDYSPEILSQIEVRLALEYP